MADASPQGSAELVLYLPIFGAIAGATLGVIGGYWVRGLEGRKAEISNRVEDIVSQIGAIQVIATVYWARQGQATECAVDVSQEAELSGRLHALNMMCEDVVPYFDAATATLIRTTVMHLRQALTSGDFASSAGRQPSSNAINAGYTVGSTLVLHLRKACRTYSRRWWGIGPRREP